MSGIASQEWKYGTQTQKDSLGQVPLDAVEMQYYRMLLEYGELAEHFRSPEGRIRMSRSCRDVATILPGDAVAHHAAIASRGIRLALLEDEASIRVWTSDREFNTRMFHRKAAGVAERTVGGFRVVTDDEFVTSVEFYRQGKLPRETGGVLLGSWDLERGIVYVVSTIPSPGDSEECPTNYIRGCSGLDSAVRDAEARTGGQLQYIGEWHSHPDGYPADPSKEDGELFEWLSGFTGQDGYPAVMLIVGEMELRWFVGRV